MMSTRFAILHHTKPQNEHWDVMLEQGDVLLTWQLAHDPTALIGDSIAALRIQDHRRKYLDYEGPISDGRGEVHQVDVGAVIFLEKSAEKFIISIKGRSISGQFQLRKICGDNWEWSAAKLRDPL